MIYQDMTTLELWGVERLSGFGAELLDVIDESVTEDDLGRRAERKLFLGDAKRYAVAFNGLQNVKTVGDLVVVDGVTLRNGSDPLLTPDEPMTPQLFVAGMVQRNSRNGAEEAMSTIGISDDYTAVKHRAVVKFVPEKLFIRGPDR